MMRWEEDQSRSGAGQSGERFSALAPTVMARLDRATRSGTADLSSLSPPLRSVFLPRNSRTGPGGPVEPGHDDETTTARRSPDCPEVGSRSRRLPRIDRGCDPGRQLFYTVLASKIVAEAHQQFSFWPSDTLHRHPRA